MNSVEWSNNPNGAIIHIFGRDIEGALHRVDVNNFRNYFYAPDSESNRINLDMEIDSEEYRSIRNERMVKIFVNKPGDVYDFRDKFSHSEGDIPYPTRFLIDLGIKSGVSFPSQTCDYKDLVPIELNYKSRVCMLDIECSDERGFPNSDKDPIICLTCFDSFEEKYTTFLYIDKDLKLYTEKKIKEKIEDGGFENGCFRDPNSVFVYTSEKEMLEDFCKYIQHTNPDIISGWNAVGFDLPYIFGRFEALNISKENLARLRGNSNRIELRGRQLFDLLDGYKRMHLGEQPSYRLDAIAFAEVGKQKIRFSGKIHQLWKTDPINLLYYNFVDVELCNLINQKDNTIEFHQYISRYVGCQLEKTLTSMPIVDAFILREAKRSNLVLPSKPTTFEKNEEFEGALVFAPLVGVQENIVVLDLKSLYPMAMVTINASIETKDPNGEMHAPNGIRFKKEPDGLVRKIQFKISNERDDLKSRRNKYPIGSDEYKHLDLEQNVVKVIANSYYGVSGNPTFRLYDKEIAAATTSVGRSILEHNRKLIQDLGYVTTGSDTDSVFVRVPKSIGREGTMAIAKDLEKLLNDSYPAWAKETLGADVQYFSVKFEKLYERFFSAGKKKRYAGLLVWKEGKDAHEIDITGFETERSDSPKVTRDAMKLLIGMVLEGKKYEEIQPVISEIVRKYRAREYPLDEIGIPGGIGKPLEDYDRPDAQVRAAIYSNRWFKTHFGKGSKPKRLYIKSVPMGYPRTDVICFEYPDEVPTGFVLDMDTMLEKTLQQPLTRILEALNWNWAEFDPATPTLAKWGLT